MVARSLVVVWLLSLASPAVAQTTQPGVTAWVSKSCSTLGSTPCYATIQECVDALEVSAYQDYGRNCLIMPGYYVESVDSDMTTGSTNLVGFGVTYDSVIPVATRIRAAENTAGGTVTLSIKRGTVKNLTIYMEPTPEAGDVGLRIAGTASVFNFVKVEDTFVYPDGRLPAGSHSIEVLSEGSPVYFENLTLTDRCGSASSSASSGLYIDTEAEIFISNSDLALQGNHTNCSGVSIIEIASAGNIDIESTSFYCYREDASCLEIDAPEGDVWLLDVTLFGPGKTMSASSGAGASLTLAGVRRVFDSPPTASSWGGITPKGDLHATFDGSPGSTDPCFSGWTATDTTGDPDADPPTPTQYLCEAGTWRGLFAGALRHGNGAAPPATCRTGELWIDTDAGNDTNCSTDSAPTLCACVAADSWSPVETP